MAKASAISNAKAYEKARQQASDAARRAQTSGDTSLKRADIHTFGVNPTTRIMVQHRQVVAGTDAAQRLLDSDAAINKDKRAVAALQKLSAGQPLPTSEVDYLTSLAKDYPTLRVSLEMYGKSVSQTYTQMRDISQTVLEWKYTRSLTKGGATLQLSAQVDAENTLRELSMGDKFYIYIEDELVYWGICMEISAPNEWQIDFVIQDLMWYLKNKLVWIQNSPVTLTDAFKNICDQLALPYEPVNIPVTVPLNKRVETNNTAMALLQTFLSETMIAMRKQFAIRMSPDKLELIDLEGRWDGNKLIQDGTGFDVIEAMTQFKATQSVQQETYNDVRIFDNINNTLKAYNVQSLPDIERYGILRYQQIVNNAIIQEQQLDQILNLTRYPTNDLSFDIIGMINLLPGDTIRLLQSIYLCNDITYTYNSSGYSMSITCARWQKPTDAAAWNFVDEYLAEKERRDGSGVDLKNDEEET